MRGVSSAFYAKLQTDNPNLADLIDLELQTGQSFHWTTANGRITYTLSGAPTEYVPFPGQGSGLSEDMNLGVSVLNFTLANSGSTIQQQLLSTDFALAGMKIGQVFIDTPDLGRMDTYIGKMGDFAYNRLEMTGQARNIWKSLNVQWPYYSYNEKCGWRFGSTGCGFNTASVTIAVGTVNVSSSTTLILALNSGTLTSSYASGRFNFGRATITGGTNSGAIRTIKNQQGDNLELSHILPNPDLTGLTLSIYPGCNKRLVEDCHSLYNNDKNYFGFPWIVTKENAF